MKLCRIILVIILTLSPLSARAGGWQTEACIVGMDTGEILEKPELRRPPANSRAWVTMSQAEVKGRALYAISDMHGHLDKTINLLSAARLVNDDGEWTGGKSILVVEGDLINKGKNSISLVLWLRDLEASAAKAGGRVIVSLGNHEGRLIRDGIDDAPAEILRNIKRKEITPQQVSDAMDYIQSRPIGAFIGDALFVHSGYVTSKSYREIGLAMDQDGLDIKDILDDPDNPLLGAGSVLEASRWDRGAKLEKVRKFAAKLGIRVIIFGHQPYAFGETGMAMSEDGAFVKIDCGMGNGRKGAILKCVDAAMLSVIGGRACGFVNVNGAVKDLVVVPQ